MADDFDGFSFEGDEDFEDTHVKPGDPETSRLGAVSVKKNLSKLRYMVFTYVRHREGDTGNEIDEWLEENKATLAARGYSFATGTGRKRANEMWGIWTAKGLPRPDRTTGATDQTWWVYRDVHACPPCVSGFHDRHTVDLAFPQWYEAWSQKKGLHVIRVIERMPCECQHG